MWQVNSEAGYVPWIEHIIDTSLSPNLSKYTIVFVLQTLTPIEGLSVWTGAVKEKHHCGPQRCMASAVCTSYCCLFYSMNHN